MANEVKQSCHSCMCLLCINLLYNPTKYQSHLLNGYRVILKKPIDEKYGSGDKIKNKDKQSCHSCMLHSALTWSISLPSTPKIFVTVVDLCSGSQSEEKIWIRGHI